MKRLLSLVIIVLLLLVAVRGWWGLQLSPVSNDTQTKTFVIPKGQGVSEVAEALENDGLIRSALAFKLYVRQTGLVGQIQAGSFKLSPSLSAEEIVKTFRIGAEDVWVTLIEGWRIEEVAEKLNQALGVKNAEFLKAAKEGYMFPDTYLFPKDFTAEQIAKRLKDTFESKFTSELRSKIKAQGLTEEEGIILASIVEREGRSQEVRRMVASILLKRLKIDMGLNADATIQYALGYQPDEKSWWKRHLIRDDLKIKSTYNTYLHAGLPPTPICNPSLSAIKAVAEADPVTSYLYYYHDSKGNSHYAKTLEEHNENIANNP